MIRVRLKAPSRTHRDEATAQCRIGFQPVWAAGRLGTKKDEWRKQAVEVSLVATEKRPRTKDDDEDEEDRDITLNRYLPWVSQKNVFSPEGAPGAAIPQLPSEDNPRRTVRSLQGPSGWET
jgi:hypothetical protein